MVAIDPCRSGTSEGKPPPSMPWLRTGAAALVAMAACARTGTPAGTDLGPRDARAISGSPAGPARSAAGREAPAAGDEAPAGGSASPEDGPRARAPECAEVCAQQGSCTLVHGVCRATSDEDCRQSQACMERGECSLERGSCNVRRDEDCAGSRGCIERGECRAKGGLCWVAGQTREECDREYGTARFNGCVKYGWCTPHPGGVCMPGSDEDCRASVDCAEEGRCSHLSLWAAGRVFSDFCGAQGRDCQGARACGTEGRCVSFSGHCFRSCDGLPGCEDGACSEKDGECRR